MEVAPKRKKCGIWEFATLILIISVFLLSVLAVSFVFLWISSSLSAEEEIISKKTYKYYQLNSHTNDRSVGMISSEYEPPSSFNEKSGNYLLVSEIGTPQYHCTGACYCKEEKLNRRSSSATVLGRSLIYLVSALTAAVAYQNARNYFEDECVEKYSSFCSSEVESEVGICEETGERLMTKEEMLDGVVDAWWRRPFFYTCKGKCMKSDTLGKEMAADKKLDRICKKLEIEGEVMELPQEMEFPVELSDEEENFVFDKKILVDIMKDKFVKEKLNPFCLAQGKYSPSGEDDVFSVDLCVGEIDGENPSVRCVLVKDDPEDLEFLI